MILCDILPRDIVILKILDAEIGWTDWLVLETEWIESITLGMGLYGAEC